MISNEKLKNITIKQGELNLIEFQNLSKLFKRVFKKEFSPEFLNWYYFLNPNGTAITYNAFNNNELIGHYALLPIKIRLYEKEFDAALSMFTAIDENFRGLYLFNELAKKSYNLAKDKGFKFIIGVSNQISTKLFIRYFKFKFISQLDVKFGFGHINKIDHPSNFKVLWNDKSLSWRLKNPRFNYQSKFYKDNILIYNNFYKFFKIEMGRFPKNQFFDVFQGNKNNNNFSFLNLWIGLGKYQWKNKMYFNLPEKLKPAPLNFIIKNISGEHYNISLDKDNVDFQLIDFDIF
tara:strand:+ start:59 stop:931 length:873 start_codon:yes stop_codon:yes gene_type:complete